MPDGSDYDEASLRDVIARLRTFGLRSASRFYKRRRCARSRGGGLRPGETVTRSSRRCDRMGRRGHRESDLPLAATVSRGAADDPRLRPDPGSPKNRVRHADGTIPAAVRFELPPAVRRATWCEGRSGGASKNRDDSPASSSSASETRSRAARRRWRLDRNGRVPKNDFDRRRRLRRAPRRSMRRSSMVRLVFILQRHVHALLELEAEAPAHRVLID